MFRNLFQSIFGIFFRKKSLNDKERELIHRMIVEAQAIADGSYITESNLPKPQIPERRSKPRE